MNWWYGLSFLLIVLGGAGLVIAANAGLSGGMDHVGRAQSRQISFMAAAVGVGLLFLALLVEKLAGWLA